MAVSAVAHPRALRPRHAMLLAAALAAQRCVSSMTTVPELVRACLWALLLPDPNRVCAKRIFSQLERRPTTGKCVRRAPPVQRALLAQLAPLRVHAPLTHSSRNSQLALRALRALVAARPLLALLSQGARPLLAPQILHLRPLPPHQLLLRVLRWLPSALSHSSQSLCFTLLAFAARARGGALPCQSWWPRR